MTWHFWHPVLASVTAVSLSACSVPYDKGAEVVILRDRFDVRVFTTSRVLSPITAEGPFPKTTDGARLTSSGPPEEVMIDGVPYLKFTIGRNICSMYNELPRGTVLLSEVKREVVIDAELATANSSKGIPNPSGRYSSARIDRPPVIEIDDSSTVPDLLGKYVIATGRFSNGDSQFLSHGLTFDTNGFRRLNESRDYEVIGAIIPPLSSKSSLPIIRIVSYRLVDDPIGPAGCRR